MSVQRFLGSEWATVHGPAEPRRLLTWALERQFGGLLAAPGPRAIDWSAVRVAAADLPVAFAGVRVASAVAAVSSTAGLVSAREGDQQAALAAVRLAVATARALGCPHVVLDLGVVPVLGEIEAEDLGEPGYAWTPERSAALLARRQVQRNQALDRSCRIVHQLVRSQPDIGWSITVGRSLRTVADRTGLRDLFEDLHQLRIGYWHDAAVAARREQVLGEAQGEWLEEFGNRCRGISLGDASPEGMYLPPGAGGVDYGLLATYVPRSGRPFPVVLELDPSVAPAELAGMKSCLDKYGL